MDPAQQLAGHTQYNHVYYVYAEEMQGNPAESKESETESETEESESEHIDNRISIAIRPDIFDGRISWEDTSRGRTEIVTDVDLHEAPHKIVAKTRFNEKLTFVKLSLDEYNAKIRDWVYNKPTFDSTEALEKYYLETNFHEYG